MQSCEELHMVTGMVSSHGRGRLAEHACWAQVKSEVGGVSLHVSQ